MIRTFFLILLGVFALTGCVVEENAPDKTVIQEPGSNTVIEKKSPDVVVTPPTSGGSGGTTVTTGGG